MARSEQPELESDVEAFFRGEVVCEQHPDKSWPHGDCPGPGKPPPRPGRVSK